MATGLEHQDDDAMEEILRRALRHEGSDANVLRDRLLAAADELGISHDSVLRAESEYRQDAVRAKELATYRKEQRREFRGHLAIYAAVNAGLILINILTYQDDHELWALFPLLGWGIGLLIHAISALAKPDWDDEDFQKWRKKRKEAESSPLAE